MGLYPSYILVLFPHCLCPAQLSPKENRAEILKFQPCFRYIVSPRAPQGTHGGSFAVRTARKVALGTANARRPELEKQLSQLRLKACRNGAGVQPATCGNTDSVSI